MDNWPQYLIRNRGILDAREQERLRQATVAVIGCGGLGGFVIEELARMGIGRLLLVDPDRFEESNCNRQLYADLASLGRHKARVAAERVQRIHGLCRPTPLVADFREKTEILVREAMVLVDCLDNGRARRALADVCAANNKALVHGAVNGWYGQVAVQPPGQNLVGRLYPPAGDDLAPPSVLGT